jgi:lysophospholipase L1-like esterase
MDEAARTLHQGRRAHRMLLLAAAILAGLLGGSTAWPQQSDVADPSHWVATWTSAPADPGPALASPPPRAFKNQTVRQIAHISVGGRRLRVRLSNLFGKQPLLIGSAHMALHDVGASIVPGSDRTLKFGGRPSVTIPVGATALSDAVNLDVPSLGNLAVSLYLPNDTGPATFHDSADQTAYISVTGDFTGSIQLPTAETAGSRYFLTGIEVAAQERLGAVVAIGASITEGFGSSVDANRRWPDLLSARLNSPKAPPRIAILNQGIGCNRLLRDVCGPSGLSRFHRDVLAQPGVTHVIVDLGLVDIALPTVLGIPEEIVSADEIILGLIRLIDRAHAKGLEVYGATFTPNEGSTFPGFHTPENEAKRQAVNRWIRTSGEFDGVIDFDLAVRDPSRPLRLLPHYDSGDGTHPSDAGYEAMARSIDLSLFP